MAPPDNNVSFIWFWFAMLLIIQTSLHSLFWLCITHIFSLAALAFIHSESHRLHKSHWKIWEIQRKKKSHFILHLARLIALGYNSIVLLIAKRVETWLCAVKLSLERNHLRLTNWCTEANTGSCQGAARISPFICNFDCTQKRSEMRWKKFSPVFPAHQRSSFSCFLSSSALWRAKNEANSFNILCAHLKWDKREKH